MSTVNVGNQDKKNLSIGRGRGKRSNQQKTTQIQNDAYESKSESQSKIPGKTPSTRVSRGRGWKRPDQAIYVPKALRKENPKDNDDSQSTKDKCRGEDKVCQLKKKDEDIFSDSDSFLEQKGAGRQTLTRQYPEEEETAVSVASRDDPKSCEILNEKGTEPPVKNLSESSTANNLCSNEASSFDMNKKTVGISDIDQECEEKNISEKKKDEEEQTEEILSIEDDTCGKSCAESEEKEKEEKLWKNENKIEIENACSTDQNQAIDIHQSRPPVTSCVESDEKETGQKLLENQERIESKKLDQEKPVIDNCQSSSSVVVDNTKNEEEISLKVQDIQENIVKRDEEQCLSNNTSLVLDKCITEGEAEENEFSEENKLLRIENKGGESQCTDTCQSSLTDAEINTEMHDKHDICLQEGMCATALEQDAALDTVSKIVETCDEECLPKETSSHVLMDIKDESNSILKGNSEQGQVDDKSFCFKNEVITEQSSQIVNEVTSDTNDSNKKNELLSQNQEDQRKSDDFKILEVQGSIDSEQVKDISGLDVGNIEKEGIGSDDVVNNEKRPDEKERKHKKKSKKKKGEEEPKEEKKKKKSKKKENENEEAKEKENDEKHKLKKKEKKKASKEDSGTKSKDSKSKEKAKEKKDEKCKNRNESNNDDDESWESKFNEDGECLDPELLEELTEATGIKKPSKRKTQFDYYALPPKEVTLDDNSGYGHIVELYDFSSELKTQDLVQLLASFKSQGYDITWVDDTHALAVFSSEIAAKQAIQMCSSPKMKLRPVSQGTSESKSKAQNCLSFLQPYKPRPQTTKLAAHRLVTGALGVRSTMTKEEREREREKIKEAKEQKRQEKQRKADIWGD